MNNNRQIILAWTMYSGDNSEHLAINSDRSLAYEGGPSWISGELDYTTGTDNTNVNNLIGSGTSLFGPYLGNSYKVFADSTAAFSARYKLNQAGVPDAAVVR